MSRQWLACCLFALFLCHATAGAWAQSSKTKNEKTASAAAVDRAYLQSIWDGWAAADLDKQGQYYAQGPGHLFFDVAPLKYTSWDEYRAGVAPPPKDAKVTYTVNDDFQIHPAGNITWVAATLTMSGNTPDGQQQSLPLRWTAVFEQQNGHWVIVHEHVSAAAEPPQQQ